MLTSRSSTTELVAWFGTRTFPLEGPIDPNHVFPGLLMALTNLAAGAAPYAGARRGGHSGVALQGVSVGSTVTELVAWFGTRTGFRWRAQIDPGNHVFRAWAADGRPACFGLDAGNLAAGAAPYAGARRGGHSGVALRDCRGQGSPASRFCSLKPTPRDGDRALERAHHQPDRRDQPCARRNHCAFYRGPPSE